MKRRKFLQYSGIGLAGTSIAKKITQISTEWKKSFVETSDVIVVGAGTFGVWTAYHLLNKGAKVTLLDAYGPGNSRASSGGETRLIQTDTDNEIYVKSAKRSFALWKRLEEESGRNIVLSTGRLAMSGDISYRQYALNRKEQLASLGIDNTEVLSHDEIRYRWPQIYTEDIVTAMFNDSGPSGSTLMARKGIQAVARQYENNGGSLIIAKGIPLVENGKVEGIDIGNAEALRAQYYVFACGPWLSKIFPTLLLPRLQVQRRDVLFVGTPPGDDRFSYPNLPEWSVHGSGYYGFPDIEGRGLKVAPYPDFNSFDPDIDERVVNPYQVKRAHDFARKRFPALGDQPIVESRVCQITNSIDSNFIVDQLPDSDNTWIIGGGSGHGFKHGPAIGEHAANRILGMSYDLDFSQEFKLKEEVFNSD